ncbi:MAG: FtsX-like permease family protein [Gemmatimonadetes bacterium]|nr:FtsX-like permease family protein [Gemmatimonadota bacterium]MYG83947.1 FtsX-like permease family protein [Gemmatimonadota bacterium]MYJ91135.1 FtsX-like permease family protein [Gemmatimonadota bacterium]
MLRNYLSVALRNLRRHPAYSLINISGLAIGMATCILILLYIQDEFGYDRYHPHADRVYRIVDDIESGGQTVQTAGTPTAWGPALKRDFPEIELLVRMRGTGSAWLVDLGNTIYYERKVIWAEPELFEMFSMPLVLGDPGTALDEPYSMVISEDLAFKYFGTEDPVGKVVNLDNRWDFMVTGVMKNIPTNSHMRPDMFVSYTTMNVIGSWDLGDWEFHRNLYTYIRLRENVSPSDFEAKLPAFLERHAGDQYRESGISLRPSLQPLVDIHLYSNRESEHEPNGDIRYVALFLIITFLILIIACINFINLATARSKMRAREVGVRKVMGANRLQLIRQFLGESVLMAVLAAIVAVILVKLALPGVNEIAGKQLALPLTDWIVLAALALGTAVIGLAAGSYPAAYLSGFLPAVVMKGNPETGKKGLGMRQVLVVIQFSMSIFLLVSTAVIHDQLEFIQTKRLGFDKEHVMVVPITGSHQVPNTPVLKQRLSGMPGVVGVATTTGVPGMRVLPIMEVRPDGMPPEDHLMMATLHVDENFLDVMDIDVVAGRNFSPDWGTDTTGGVLLNETAVRNLGWGAPIDALGRQFERLSFEGVVPGRVIGVVRDFHLRTIHEEIEPAAIMTSTYHIFVLIRIAPDNIPETIGRIEEVWRDVDPRFPLDYTFLDEDFDALYRTDHQLGEIFAVFAFLAIFVACLGLLGLASFSIQQRTREIGIRKVVGSSVSGIVVLLSKDFMKYVILANLIAWPLAYFVMVNWRQNYAYAAALDFTWFLAAGFVALVIAWLTIGVHAVKASRRNPVNALRQG